MTERIKITETISYIKATEDPLSADVGIVEGKDFVWVFDVGACEGAKKLLSGIIKPKKAVLSHFHPDHTANISDLEFDEVFAGANTFGYTKAGTTVAGDVFADDGIKIHIFLLPSSHAKGSVGMETGDYAFLGDATYPTAKKGKTCYNASVLKEEIDVLKNLSAKYFLLSHDKNFICKREEVIARLEEIYSKRDPKESYIWL